MISLLLETPKCTSNVSSLSYPSSPSPQQYMSAQATSNLHSPASLFKFISSHPCKLDTTSLTPCPDMILAVAADLALILTSTSINASIPRVQIVFTITTMMWGSIFWSALAVIWVGLVPICDIYKGQTLQGISIGIHQGPIVF